MKIGHCFNHEAIIDLMNGIESLIIIVSHVIDIVKASFI